MAPAGEPPRAVASHVSAEAATTNAASERIVEPCFRWRIRVALTAVRSQATLGGRSPEPAREGDPHEPAGRIVGRFDTEGARWPVGPCPKSQRILPVICETAVAEQLGALDEHGVMA